MPRSRPTRHARAATAILATAVLVIPSTADARYAVRTLETGSEGRDVKLFSATSLALGSARVRTACSADGHD